MRQFKGLLVMVVLLTACQAPQPLVAPPNNPNPIQLPTVDSSVINVPISIDLEAVRSEALKKIPKPLTAGTMTQVLTIANTPLPVESDISHKVTLKDLKLSVTGQDFIASTQLDFSIETKTRASFLNMGGISCGIGEELPRIEFTLPGKLYWTVGGDLAIQAGQWQVKWLKPCNITAFKFNVEKLLNLPVVRDKVQTAINDNINSSLKQLGLKAMLTKTWPQINEPKQLEKDVWLLLQPEKIGLADIVGTGRYVKTSVSVSARPQVLTGAKPTVTLPPLPQPQRLISSNDSFHLALRGDIGLETANRLLNEKLANKPFDAGGKQVLINSIRLYGSGDKAVLGLRLQQPINGEIYLLARPVLDIANNELRLEQVEFELSTTSLLAKSANWMLHGTFKNLIAEKARFNFDKDLSDTLKDFKDYHQDLGYGVVLKAQIGSVRPQGVFFTPTDIKAFVVIDGKLALDMTGNPVPVKTP
ncbi:DUF4403 family protein [Agitococcus lubricus]|uniref:Uncharacterized protein DUF4403 n=1 Tax=Agitococcus lubricus TaxID=1077255 RepID=A0A2T5J2A6_9GAMM|nr:DUF4403 family protein [Agitococcus lubricus]PTQ90649.1 uncharacterized protein DUF4403 [Agitococcus lubricus]